MITLVLLGGQFDGQAIDYPDSADVAQILCGVVLQTQATDWSFSFSPDTPADVQQVWWSEDLTWRVWRALNADRPVYLGRSVYRGRGAIEAVANVLLERKRWTRIVSDSPEGLFIESLWRVEEDVNES